MAARCNRTVGDDRRDELRGRDVEGRIVDGDAVRRRRRSERRAHFVAPRCSITMSVDRVVVAGSRVLDRRGDVKRNAVMLRGDRERKSPDLVRDVPICGDAIGADDAEIDLAARASATRRRCRRAR